MERGDHYVIELLYIHLFLQFEAEDLVSLFVKNCVNCTQVFYLVSLEFGKLITYSLRFQTQVPPYIMAQVAGSTLASGTLRLIFNGKQDVFPGTLPSGSDLQSFVLEFVITFYLMFVISGVATDNRAVSPSRNHRFSRLTGGDVYSIECRQVYTLPLQDSLKQNPLEH